MAVAVEMVFKGTTLSQYDEVMKKMGLSEPDSQTPAGALFHWVTQTGDGIKVVDVWESAEQFDRFAAEKIGPITQEVGIGAPPEMTRYEVHNYLAG
jgi:hypothetical protein